MDANTKMQVKHQGSSLGQVQDNPFAPISSQPGRLECKVGTLLRAWSLKLGGRGITGEVCSRESILTAHTEEQQSMCEVGEKRLSPRQIPYSL